MKSCEKRNVNMKKFQREFLINRIFTILMTASLVITFSLICGMPRALAQSTVANLSGTVVDPAGAVVPGAAVTIVDPATNLTRETVTNDAGIYTFPSLAPGSYMVTARSSGFAAAEIKDVVLNVNDRRSLQIQLTVGDVGATVQVTAEPSLVDESPAVTTTVDRTLVENLPLPGRSFQGLIALSPGVVVTGTDLFDQGQFSVNGQRRSSNGFYVDGVSANFGGASGANFGQQAGGSLPAFSAQGGTNSLVSVDALQEFTIQTSTYAAEFGRQPGAQISILTRSGKNKFEGTLFEYFRNDALDANDFFNNKLGLPKPPLRLNQFGGVLGGPLYLPHFGEGGPVFTSGKDRTFFFFSYEGLRLSQPQNRQTDVPSLAARAAAPAAIRPFFNAYPLPNGPVSPTDPNTAQFNASFSDPSDLNTYSIRIDHHVNDRLQIFGRYNDSKGNTIARAPVSDQLSASSVFDTDFITRTLTLGAISPFTNSLVNDFRFNYSTNQTAGRTAIDNFGGAVPFTVSDFFAGTPQPFTAETGLFGFQLFGGARQASLFTGKNTTNTQKQINIVDHLSVVKGNHNLKFGVDYRRLSPSFDPRAYVGAVFYLDFTAAIANLPAATVVQQSRQGNFYFNNLGFYAQDTWKAAPRLTLTYGLRYDLDFTPTLGGGLQPLAVTSAGFDDPRQLALAPEGTQLYKTTYNNFAPRVGVAYQLRQKAGQETILRGGFGVFYDLASQYVGQIAQANTPPFGAASQLFGPGICPLFGIPPPCPFTAGVFPLTPASSAPPPITRDISASFGLSFINPEIKLPYSLQWNLAVEQSLGSNQTLSVSYVASRGYRLLQSESVGGTVSPNFNSPLLLDNTADSQYDSMQVQFQRRLSQGLQAIASYTWAHSIDSASTASLVSRSSGFARSRPEGNRGNSDFDIRHAFNAAVSYNIPAPFENKPLRAILGGWSLDAIFVARTAPPLTVITFGLTPPFENAFIRPDLVPGVPIFLFGDQYPGGKALNPAAFVRPPTAVDATGVRRVTRQGTAGRNAFRGFGAYQLDFALRREFKLRERLRLQFKGELFNIFNHPNFGAVDTTLSFNAAGQSSPSPTFGQSTSMLGRSLGAGGIGGGFSPLFQIGGPRSTQLSLRLVF